MDGLPLIINRELACQIFHCSKSTYLRRVKELEEYVRNGRYPKGSIIHDTAGVKVATAVYMDFLNYRKQLSDRYAKKYVPPFNIKDYGG